MNLEEKISNLLTISSASPETLVIIQEKIVASNNLKELLDVLRFIGSLNLKFRNKKSIKSYMYIFSLVFFWIINWVCF